MHTSWEIGVTKGLHGWFLQLCCKINVFCNATKVINLISKEERRVITKFCSECKLQRRISFEQLEKEEKLDLQSEVALFFASLNTTSCFQVSL